MQWLLGLVCIAVVALTVAALVTPGPAPDPTQTDEWEGLDAGYGGAALLILWVGAFAPAWALLFAIRLRSRVVSWGALILACVLFLLEIAATVVDGLEGWGDGRPWMLAGFAGVLLLASARKSLAYLGVVPGDYPGLATRRRAGGT